MFGIKKIIIDLPFVFTTIDSGDLFAKNITTIYFFISGVASNKFIQHHPFQIARVNEVG
jgi:hypothetical protein